MMIKYRTELIILLTGILVGVLFTFINVLYVLALIFGVIVFAVISLLVILVGLFTKSKARSIGLACFLSSLLVIGSYFGLGRLNEIKREQVAATVINGIEDYEKKNGIYPTSLREINVEQRFIELRYKPSDDGNYYTISYLMNGYHRRVYSSKTGTWTTMQ